MLAKAIYLGYYPLGGDLEIDGIKIMQFEWKRLLRPIILPFGKTIQGVSPTFSHVFAVTENEKTIFFLVNEHGIGKYHIWFFSDKVVKKLREHKNCELKSETLRYYHPRFSTILRPFAVICQVETLVTLSQKGQTAFGGRRR